jgi:phosphonate transport system ATP-binding protein
LGFSVQQVTYQHASGSVALKNISLSAAAGECLAIIGASGSGKTTLLNILATALRPSSGSIRIHGLDPWALTKSQLRQLRSKIGLVHQVTPIPLKQRVVTAILAGRIGQWPLWKSILSLLYPLDIAGARACLARLDLEDRLFDRCDRLSGGQLQRVGVARVLYQSPDLLLTDEPISALDPALSDVIISQLMDEAHRRQITLVASLHAVDVALRWFPRIVGVRRGEIVFDLPASAVKPDMLQALYATELTQDS